MTWIRRIASLLLVLAITLLLLEAALQLGALVLRHSGRATTEASGSAWPGPGLRILALGDSNTYGLYFPAEQSWPSRLQVHWNEAHAGQPVAVLNLAYPGTNSFRVLAYMDRFLEKTQPDMVLVMVGNNDLWTPAEDVSGDPSAQVDWVNRLAAHSRAYRLGVMLLQQFRGNPVDTGERMVLEPAGKDTGEARQSFFQALQATRASGGGTVRPDVITLDGERFQMILHNGAPSAKLGKLVDNLAAMAGKAKAHHVPMVLLTYPSNNNFYPGVSVRIREAAARTGLPLVDLGQYFAGVCQGDRACPQYFLEDGHPNAAGYDLAAAYVGQQLAALIPTPAPAPQEQTP